MRRRTLLAALGTTLIVRPPGVFAQARTGAPLVILTGVGQGPVGPGWESFLSTMGTLGYVEGKDYSVAAVFEGGDPARRSETVAQIIAMRPAIVVSGSSVTAEALHAAASSVPLIFAVSQDSAMERMVRNFARPEGNVTGILQDDVQAGVVAKRIELIVEAVPWTKRIGFPTNVDSPSAPSFLAVAETTARAFGANIVVANVRGLPDIESAWDLFMRERIDAAVIQTANAMVDAAASARVPAIHRNRGVVESGGFMGYGVDTRGNYPQAAGYVARFLRGRPFAELPVVPPSMFELAVNMKAARELGVVFPISLLARADVVIE